MAYDFSRGDNVVYPADRGNPPGVGIVLSVSDIENESFSGQKYFWIEIQIKGGHKTVWPSNRLKLSSVATV